MHLRTPHGTYQHDTSFSQNQNKQNRTTKIPSQGILFEQRLLLSNRSRPVFGSVMAAVRLLIILSLFPLFCHSISEAEALLKLKNSFTINANSLSSWVPNQSPCQAQWVGVICSKDTINGLRLSSMRLSGKIDIEALQNLRTLRIVSFVDNDFNGPIPEFNKLGALKALFLSNNKFSGEIPNDFFSPLNSIKKIWLDQNNFSGKIPESLTEISNILLELHLENNQFTGPIPNLQSQITSLSFSNNKLEGEIPPSLSNLPPELFLGNAGLCGKPLDKVCTDKDKSPPSKENNNNDNKVSIPPSIASKENNPNTTDIVIWSVVAGSLVMLLLLAIFKKRRGRDNEFIQLGKEKVGDVVEVHVPSPNYAKSTESISIKQGNGDSRKGSVHSNKSVMTDIVMVNDEKGSFGLSDLMKAAAEMLGNGGTSSTYKALMSFGLSVVVKRMKEMNVLGRNGFDEEIRRFGGLKHKNILTPLAYHYRREEKLLVSEYIPKGSLLYVLHGDRGASHADLNWPIRLKIIKGIARGMGFLHSIFKPYELPHGNLKSSNILLDDDYEPLLNDYAFQPLMNPNHAKQVLLAYKCPEYLKSQQVSHKSDVYCLGIIILEVITGKFPSQYLNNGNGGTDVVEWVLTTMADQGKERELLDPDIINESNSEEQLLQLLKIGAVCVQKEPNERLQMEEAIRRIEEIRI